MCKMREGDGCYGLGKAYADIPAITFWIDVSNSAAVAGGESSSCVCVCVTANY